MPRLQQKISFNIAAARHENPLCPDICKNSLCPNPCKNPLCLNLCETPLRDPLVPANLCQEPLVLGTLPETPNRPLLLADPVFIVSCPLICPPNTLAADTLQ
jgi:hypothetical protein